MGEEVRVCVCVCPCVYIHNYTHVHTHTCARSVFTRFRAVLHEGSVEKRVQYVIEGMLAVRRAGFDKSGFPAVRPELDLVDAGGLKFRNSSMAMHSFDFFEGINFRMIPGLGT